MEVAIPIYLRSKSARCTFNTTEMNGSVAATTVNDSNLIPKCSGHGPPLLFLTKGQETYYLSLVLSLLFSFAIQLLGSNPTPLGHALN